MRVWLVVSPGDGGRTIKEAFTDAAAIRMARAAHPRPAEDTRSEAAALDDFVVVNWAESITLEVV